MPAGSRVIGAASLRRTLQRMDGVLRDELADTLEAIGQRLLTRARSETPRRSGKLAAGLDAKVSRKTLVLRIGLLTKARRRELFYGYILDQGRRAQTVTVTRKKNAAPYQLRVKSIARERYNFVFGRRADFRANELPAMRLAVEDALHRVVEAGGND